MSPRSSPGPPWRVAQQIVLSLLWLLSRGPHQTPHARGYPARFLHTPCLRSHVVLPTHDCPHLPTVARPPSGCTLNTFSSSLFLNPRFVLAASPGASRPVSHHQTKSTAPCNVPLGTSASPWRAGGGERVWKWSIPCGKGWKAWLPGWEGSDVPPPGVVPLSPRLA